MTDESWFYVLDPLCKGENMQWIWKDENHPQAVMKDRNCKKIMFVPFFDRQGMVHMEFMENGTITKEIFHEMLKRARVSLQNRHGSRVWNQSSSYKLHMDNAGPHRSYLVRGQMRVWDWPIASHPPYSPDLSPADFFLFPPAEKAHERQGLQDCSSFERSHTARGRPNLLPPMETLL